MEFVEGDKYVTGGTTLENGESRFTLDVEGKLITAASIIPVVNETDEKGRRFLLAAVQKDITVQYQSIGGKVERSDMHWKHTALREFCEEARVKLPMRDTLNMLRAGNHAHIVYREQSKHVYWFYPVPYMRKLKWTRPVSSAPPKEKEVVKWTQWMSTKDLEGVAVRPDVAEVLSFYCQNAKPVQ